MNITCLACGLPLCGRASLCVQLVLWTPGVCVPLLLLPQRTAKTQWLEQHKCVISQLWAPWAEVQVWAGCVPVRRLWKATVSCSFRLLPVVLGPSWLSPSPACTATTSLPPPSEPGMAGRSFPGFNCLLLSHPSDPLCCPTLALSGTHPCNPG